MSGSIDSVIIKSDGVTMIYVFRGMYICMYVYLQAELFSRAAKHLQDVVETLPQDKVCICK